MYIDDVPLSELELYYASMPPIPTPERHVEYVDIKGRGGSLTKKYGYHDTYYPIEMYFYEQESFRKAFRKVKPKLLNAKRMSFADDDEVYYKVKSVQINEADSEVYKFGRFLVDFVLDPFMYSIDNNPITISSSQTIQNDGYTALPKIKVWCSGNGELTINNQTVQIAGVNGTIVIDSELVQTYQEGSPPINASNKTVGDYPILKTGNNTISFNGDISKLEVTPNFRWR